MRSVTTLPRTTSPEEVGSARAGVLGSPRPEGRSPCTLMMIYNTRAPLPMGPYGESSADGGKRAWGRLVQPRR